MILYLGWGRGRYKGLGCLYTPAAPDSASGPGREHTRRERKSLIIRSSFIECCVHCFGLQMSHVSFSFQLLSLSGRIVSSQSSLLDHRPMFVLVSLFVVSPAVFLLSAEYHNVLCVSHYVARIRQLSVFQVVFTWLFPLHQFSAVHQCLWYEKWYTVSENC